MIVPHVVKGGVELIEQFQRRAPAAVIKNFEVRRQFAVRWLEAVHK